jgi:AcrR family transcriptional regulator
VHGTQTTHRREDARRNHERIFAAATEVFAEHGVQGTIPQVAARANVGKATIYRSYATKEDLIASVSRQHFLDLERRTTEALTEADAYQAFARYLLDLFDNLAQNRLLADTLAEETITPLTVILDLMDQLLTKAKKSGPIRADASLIDIRVVLCGAVLQLMRLEVRDRAVWQRYGELVINALRP